MLLSGSIIDFIPDIIIAINAVDNNAYDIDFNIDINVFIL